MCTEPKAWKQCTCRIPAIQTDRRPSMFFSILKWLRAIDIKEKVFAKPRTSSISTPTIILLYHSYRSRGSHTHRRVTEGKHSDKKQKQIEDIFQTGSRSFRREVGALVVVYNAAPGILRKNLKIFSYRLQIEQRLSETEKENHVSLHQLGNEKLKENLSIFQNIDFSDKCSHSLRDAVNREYYRSWVPDAQKRSSNDCRAFGGQWPGALTPNLSYESIRFLDGGTVSLYKYERVLQYYYFPKVSYYPSNMIFQ